MKQLNEEASVEKASVLMDALSPDRVLFLEENTKKAALEALIDAISDSPNVQNRVELARAIFAREELMSTGIGLGMAVPHVRIPSVTGIVAAVGISREGIADYDSLDDKPVHLIFLIAAPDGQHTQYLRLLSFISLRAKTLNGRLLACNDAEEFHQVLMGGYDDTAKGTNAG